MRSISTCEIQIRVLRIGCISISFSIAGINISLSASIGSNPACILRRIWLPTVAAQHRTHASLSRAYPTCNNNVMCWTSGCGLERATTGRVDPAETQQPAGVQTQGEAQVCRKLGVAFAEPLPCKGRPRPSDLGALRAWIRETRAAWGGTCPHGRGRGPGVLK